MKRITGLILTVILLFSLCSCGGNYQQINLQDKTEIPDDGIITSDMITKIKNKNAIAGFVGEDNGFSYEWTIFGSDIKDAQQINLLAKIRETDTGDIVISLSQNGSFGFTAHLSVYLNRQWDALSATAYDVQNAVCPVTLTGTGQTILNISTDGSVAEMTVRPDIDRKEISGSEDGSGEDGIHNTDPAFTENPVPVEPEDQNIDKNTAYSCTFSINCATILNNLSMLDADKLEMIPSDGIVLEATEVTFHEGESVFDVLQRVCKEKGIHLESSWTPIYNSAYIEGMHNLYEFDCGALSGWMYRVNGWYPNYGCSRYQLKDGDVIEFRYTCDFGNDIGGKNVF